jgi:NAD(P)H-hydrate epimerase
VRVLTVEAMRALDAAACASIGDVTLMRRAGRAAAAVTRAYHAQGRVVALVGHGNNGGDALAALAELDALYERIALVFHPAARVSEARRNAEERARAAGVVFHFMTPEKIAELLSPQTFFLDGLLGVGARPGMPEAVRAVTRALNERAQRAVLAMDIPTGVNADTGIPEEDALVARATICVGAVKLGLLLEQAHPYVGDLWFDDIGMANPAFAGAEASAYLTLDEISAAALLPQRAYDADKRTAGAPLIIAGSEQFPGAAVLCARAAARSGAGYVTVATPATAAATLRAHVIEQVVLPFEETDPNRAVQTILDATKHCSAIALGPGMGLSENIGAILRGVLSACALPLVIDAGALAHLAGHLHLLQGKNAVLTPHAGEFARLSGDGPIAPARRLERLRAFVREHGIVTLLKGRATLVDDGSRVFINPSASAALATAGTGDVLTGIIATLLAQGKSPFEAASLAAYWHGRAGRIAASRRPIGVMAGDVIAALASALPIASHAPPPMPMRIL